MAAPQPRYTAVQIKVGGITYSGRWIVASGTLHVESAHGYAKATLKADADHTAQLATADRLMKKIARHRK